MLPFNITYFDKIKAIIFLVQYEKTWIIICHHKHYIMKMIHLCMWNLGNYLWLYKLWNLIKIEVFMYVFYENQSLYNTVQLENKTG